MLVDSHCHLDFEAFEADFDGVLDRAAEAGVDTMVTICTRLSEFARIRAIAEAHPNIWCSLGVHPHEAEEEGVSVPDRLIELSAHPRVVGIGETGLDYYYEHSPRAEQQESFRAHIAAAVGPCIGPESYEVGPEFRQKFLDTDPQNARFFKDGARADHPMFDLPGYVEARLAALGLAAVEVSGLDTRPDGSDFFSYRRACLNEEPSFGHNIAAIALED